MPRQKREPPPKKVTQKQRGIELKEEIDALLLQIDDALGDGKGEKEVGH